jgi:hypothetical protein
MPARAQEHDRQQNDDQHGESGKAVAMVRYAC